VCAFLSLCLSYRALRLLVSPRFQQQLHSCGVAFLRGPNERSFAKHLYIEAEGGTHHSSEMRRRGEHEGSKRGGRVDEEVANTRE